MPHRNLPAGAKKDLLLLLFAKALMITPRNNKNLQDVVYLGNRHHNQINRRIDLIINMIDHAVNTLMTPELASWLDGKVKTRMFSFLTWVNARNIEMQLETFGLYILFVNFCERKKPLIGELIIFADPDLYFDKIEMFKEAGLDDDSEVKAMNLAYEAIAQVAA